MTLGKQNVLIDGEKKLIRIFHYLSFVFIGIINTFLGPILPFLNEKWQMNDVQTGYFLAAQSLGGLSSTFVISFLYDRFSSKQILLSGYVFIIIALLGLSGDNFEAGIFSSFLSGAALGIIIPTTTLIVSQIAGENRAAAINLLNFFWALGAILSPLLFFLLSSATDLNYFFAALAVAEILLLAVLFKLKDVRVVSNKEKAKINGREKSIILFSAWLFVITVFLQIGIETAMSGWLPTFAKRVTSSDWWLLAPVFYWTGFLLSRLLSTVYLRWIGERTAILAGLLFLSGGQAFLLLTERIEVSSAGAFLTGFGAAPIFPTAIAVLSGKFEKKSPELLNYVFLLAGLSGMFFSWLIGFVATRSGALKTALIIPAICALTLFALHAFFNQRNDERKNSL